MLALVDVIGYYWLQTNTSCRIIIWLNSGDKLLTDSKQRYETLTR